jgi:penicillin-binding protein 1C
MGAKKRAAFAVCILAGVMLACLAWLSCAPCPHPLEGVSFSRLVVDRNGELMRLGLSDDQKYRVRTRLVDIPPEAVDAIVRYEDRFFWRHPGVNPLSLVRAALSMLGGGRRMGGSTITMQVVRLTHGLETGRFSAKLRQILLALQLEWRWSKADILEAYFSLAPYGGNVEGAGAAALYYFHKTPAELTPEESMALMLVPQNPSRRLPSQNNAAFFSAWHRLSKAWHGKDEIAPLRVFGAKDLPFAAPHACAELLRRPHAGERLRSTIDLGLQRKLEGQLQRFAARHRAWGINNAAALLLHWPSMEVRALAGSADFHNKHIDGQVDGTRARRSPGSTLKPFIYALALEQGIIHPLTLLADTPRSFSGYDPENFDGAFRGPLSAAEALRGSRNVPALALAARLGQPDLYAFLLRAGVAFADNKEHYGLSLVLGGAEMTMRELAGLYAMLPNKGVWRSLRLLKDEAVAAPLQLLSPEAAFVTLSMLEDGNPDHMVRSREGAIVPLRIKTGTSNGFRDAWAAGVFGPYVLVIWAGHFDNTANPLLIGGQVAAPLFTSIARELAVSEAMSDDAGRPGRNVHVERVSVCAATGDLDTSLCAETAETWFIPGVSPLRSSGVFRTILVDPLTGLRACASNSARAQTRVWEFWPTDLARMFLRAGVVKAPPPPFAPECRAEREASGAPPVIIQPKAGLVYHAGSSRGVGNVVALMADADADVALLHWFADGRHLGMSTPGEPLLWKASPGSITLRVVDDAGRSAQRRIHIRAVE